MIDKIKIKEMLDCEDDFLSELAENFISESSISMDHISNGLKTEDWDEIKRSSHKMISSTRIFEMTELTNILIKLEINSGEKKNLETIPTLVETLNTQYKEELQEIKSFIM